MSSLPRIEAARPQATLPESASTTSGAAAPGNEFAEVMRSVFSPAHAPTSTPHLSTTSVSSRPQSDRSQSSSGKYPYWNGKNASSDVAPKSAQANQVNSGGSSAEEVDSVGENSSPSSEISSQDSVQSGDGSTPTQGLTNGSLQSEEIVARSSGTAAKGNSGGTTRAAKLSVVPAGNQPPSAGSANTNEITGAAISPAITANPTVATAHILKVDAASAKDAAEQQPIAESVKGGQFLLDEVGISSEGIASLPNLPAAQQIQAAHAERGNDATPTAAENSANAVNANSSSSSNQDVGSAGSASPNQTDGSVGDSSAKNSANGSVDPSVDPSADTTTPGTSATGTQGTAGNGNKDSAADSGNGSSTHSANSTGTSNSASTLPGSSVAAKTGAGTSFASMPPGTGMPHENAVGAGSPNSASTFFASTHSSVAGNPGIPGASSSAGGQTPSDTFAALDSAASGERGVLLHAASHQVSVGITDPSLGWVEVRAERIAGQVTAALATNSAASHAALTSILPSMATYLQEHHSGVQQLQVETGLTGGQSGTGSQGQPSQVLN